jgi:hypothetical protein
LAIGFEDNGHGDVIAVHKRDVVVGLPVAGTKRELRKRHWCIAPNYTIELAIAIATPTCFVPTISRAPIAVEAAVGTAPNSALPILRDGEIVLVTRLEQEAVGGRPGAGLSANGRINVVRTLIDDDERSCVATNILSSVQLGWYSLHVVYGESSRERDAKWKEP